MSSRPANASVAARLARDVRQLAGSKDPTPFDLAERLLALKQASSAEFARVVGDLDAENRKPGGIGVSRRRAFYLVSVAERLPLAKFRHRFLRIGWSKAAAIASAMKLGQTDIDFDNLLQLAESHSVPVLKAALADGEVVAGMRCVMLRLTPAQYLRFSAAMIERGAKAVGLRALSGKEDALMALIDEVHPQVRQ